MDTIVKICEFGLLVAAILFWALFKWHQSKERARHRKLKGALGDGEIQSLFQSPDKKN
jgi:hypothetical protein